MLILAFVAAIVLLAVSLTVSGFPHHEHPADMLLHILDPLLMMIPLLLVCMPSEHRLEKLYLALDL